MKRLFLLGCLVILALIVAVPGHADLIVNGVDSSGHQLIYDTDLNITWYDLTYQGNWDQAMSWAAGLNVGGVTGWRLPQTLPVNGSTYNYSGNSYNGSSDIGLNISAPGSAYPGSTASEMANLFYVGLGNKGDYDVNGNPLPYATVNTGPFRNLNLSGYYWSGTKYAPVPGAAWYFVFTEYVGSGYEGGQGWEYEDDYYDGSVPLIALAVHSGDVLTDGEVLPDGPSTPIPGAILLFAPSLAAIVALKRRVGRCG